MAIFTQRDLLISIGGGCMTEFQLRNFASDKNLLVMSLPLDWTLSTFQGSIAYTYSVLFCSSSLQYSLNWEHGMPSFDGRDGVFLWHLPKQVGLKDEFTSSHDLLRKNYFHYDGRIRLRYEHLDRKFKHLILSERFTRLIFSYCQPNYIAAFRAFTNYSCAPSLHSMPLAYRQLIAISEIVDEVIILCPRDSIFSEEASKMEDIATIIWTDHAMFCDKQDMSLEINYKGEKGWIENVIPRFLV